MGAATVERFVEEGARVVVADLNEENGRALIDELTDKGHGNALRFITTDVVEEKDIAAMIETATNTFGRLDVLFNNAGVGGAIGPITEVEAEHWDYTFDVLTKSVFLGVKHGARVMIEQGSGSIINTASVAGLGGGSGPTPYSAAKAAVVNFTKNAALELARHRVRVNAICPGLIFTPLMHRGREEQAEGTMRKVQPWPDRGEGKHIAGAALYLASNDSEFVTGEAHVVDGGYTSAGGLSGQAQLGSGSNGFVGVTHGTTGKSPEVRRLNEK
jgi:NAD(P)-dependent dehydrogenase (short-subunit alcohol dehydrogenase family)